MARKRYRAFLSYSQQDKAVVRRLQRWLETYRVPRGIAADVDPNRGLGRFFRDDDEMPASSDLAATLRGAIEDSESLIVVCSPHAARSRWVNEEVLHFRGTRRGDRIFAIIAGGAPNSGDPDTECFPSALRVPAEPLALDPRKESKARLTTRLAAGLLNIPFDDLWRREQRRRRIRGVQVAAALLIAVSLVGMLAYRMLSAQRIARAQERSVRLAGALDALDTNGPMALSTVRDLLASAPDDERVSDVARTVASWARTPSETAAAFPPPRLFTSSNRLFLRGSGTSVPIGDAVPVRRIGFSRGRLIVVYGDRIVAADQASGKILHTIGLSDYDLPQIEWSGLAFEAPDGTGLVAGEQTAGVSAGRQWHVLLVVTKDGALSVFLPMNHPAHDDPWRSRFIGQVFISPGCDTLGIPDYMQEGIEPAARMKFLLSIRNGLGYAGFTEAMPGDLLTLLPGSNRYGIEQKVEALGCRNPAFDSAGRHELAGLAGIVLSTDVTASPAPPAEWRSGPAVQRGPWNERPRQRKGFNPCARGCPTLNTRGDRDEFDGTGGYAEGWEPSTGWVESAVPARGAIAGSLAGEFAARPLYTFHEQHNAGLESVWCRSLGSERSVCVTNRPGIEYRQDWSDIDQRSASGRYVLYSTGQRPFEVIDVERMQVATPPANPLMSAPGAAAFSDMPDDRLFVISDHRLCVFEPNPATRKFADVSPSLAWNRRLGGTDDANTVTGLTSHPSGDLIAVLQNGSLIRFQWQTGRTVWSRQLMGLGRIRAIRRSRSAEYVALVGERGIRVVRVRDGLIASGILLPPYVIDLTDLTFDSTPCADEYNTAEITGVMSDVTVSDGGEVTITCGATQFSWAPRVYPGNVRERIDALLASR